MIKLKLKYLLILFIYTSSVGLFSQPLNKSNAEEKKINHITVSSEPDYPPYCFINKHGKAEGFSIDLFNASIAAVGIKAEIKIGIWSQIKQDLADGKIDALPLVVRTPEREALYDFTFPYLTLHGAVFVRKGTKGINSLDDLKNKEIVVMKGDNAEEFVRRENITDKVFTTFTFDDAFRELAEGKYDAVITQRVLGLKIIDELGIKSVEPLNFQIPKFRQDFCFAVKKGNTELLNRLNEGLSIVIANHTYDEIHLKWFGPSTLKQYSVKDIVTIVIYVLIPSLLLFAVISIFILRSQIRKRTKKLKQEILEHKETAITLKKQQTLLKEMEAVSKIGGWTFDIANNKFQWTDGVYNIYGVNKNDFDPNDKNKIIGFYNAEDQIILDKSFNQTLLTGEPYSLELNFVSADGKNKLVRTNGRAEIINGKVVRIYGNIIDITEQRELENVLFETKLILQAAMDQSQAGIVIANAPDGKMRYVNKAGINILGGEKKFSIEQTGLEKYSEIWQIKDINRKPLKSEEIPLERAILNGETSSKELIITRGVDDERIILSNAAPIKDNNGNIIAGIAVFLDITESQNDKIELQRLNNELETRINSRTEELNEKVLKLDKSQKAMLYMVEDLNRTTAELKSESAKLELSNKELESFSYSVSHDLRAPLRAIQGFTGFLKEDYNDKLDSEGKRIIDVIQLNTKKMDQLINDLLNLSRITRIKINPINVNMKSLAKNIFDEDTTSDQKENFTFTVNNIPSALGDSSLLKQVWHNLISNALKYSSKSDRKIIEIGYAEDDKENIYFIKDEGAGFDPKYKHKLFGVFQRLHSTEDFEGTGVGLAIVQRIIHRHSGRVWAESEINKGAAFYFSIPK